MIPRRRALPALTLSEGGVVGQVDGAAVLLDVHHRDRPASKNRAGTNGISVGFTSHYAAPRARCGDHLSDGSAGENISIATARAFGEEAFPDGLVIETADGQRLLLERVVVAEPCVEFTRFALRYTADTPSDASVTATLVFPRPVCGATTRPTRARQRVSSSATASSCRERGGLAEE